MAVLAATFGATTAKLSLTLSFQTKATANSYLQNEHLEMMFYTNWLNSLIVFQY